MMQRSTRGSFARTLTIASAAKLNTPITDGAYGKPWVFRYKDILSWWSNLHFNRAGGVESGTPTGWTPKSKPIWMTEVGCPAVDKGPNQPNVFPDPKSSENATPYFSSGGRSDLAQRRYLEAHLDHWDPASPYFSSAGNPVSPLYGGRMLDAERIYAWAWDARPFPAFPQQSSLWHDGGNWNLGHWLNGRLGGVAVGDLINAVLADHGLPPADVRHADGTMQGYVIADPCSVRAALEPVLELYGIGAREDGDGFVFACEGASAGVATSVTDIVSADQRPAVELVRTPDQDLPAEIVLGFVDPFAEYQTASARHIRLGAGGSRQEQIGVPAILEIEQADALLADWMQRKWRERERVTFAVASSDTALLPGAVISLPGAAAGVRFLVDEVEDGLTRRVSAREIAGSAPTKRRFSGPLTATQGTPFYGKPQALFLDLPMAAGGAERDQFRAALWAKPWKSQALYASPETTGFGLRAVLPMPAFLGRLTTALPPAFHGRIDRTHTVTVAMHSGELASVSRAQLLNGANAAAVRSVSGAWEIVQFENADEIAPSLWKLTGVLRGQLGTDDAMLAGAATGADFVVLDEAVRPAGLRDSETGLALIWRAGPTGQEFSATTFAQQTVTGGLRARLPLSPVHLEAQKQAGGNVLVSWIRRSRIDADSWDGDDIPVGEEGESYRIEIASAAGALKRTATAATQSWTYAAAAIAADFPVLPANATITVRQISAAVGAGIAARLAVTLT